jgi:hypothetical protein
MMNRESLKPKSVDDILTEQELLDLLGVTKSKLTDLRCRHKLPFCRVSLRHRIYLVSDVLDFIVSKRIVLDKDVDMSD